MKRMIQLVLCLPLAAQLFAGGFWLEIGNPSASPEARAKNAVLVARLTGCHNPEKAAIAATAEGIVDGKAQSVPLTLIPLSSPGVYALRREWPLAGTWVVKVVAMNNGLTTSFVVRMDQRGFDRASARYFQRAPNDAEVAALLGKKA